MALLGLPYVPNYGNPRRHASKICENHQRRSRSFWLHHTRLRLNQYLRCTSRNPGSRGPARSTCKEPPSSPSQLVPYSDEAVRGRRAETACSFLRLPFNNSISTMIDRRFQLYLCQSGRTLSFQCVSSCFPRLLPTPAGGRR